MKLNAHSCVDCLPGYYEPDGASSRCLDCELGHASNQTASTRCNACSKGRYATTLDNEATSNVGNQTKSIGVRLNAEECLECSAGSYEDEDGATACNDCSAGHASDEVGRTEACDSCLAGTYAGLNANEFTHTGAEACIDCAVARYAHGDRQSECKWCQAGTAEPNTGSTQCPDCGDGKFAEERCSECKTCPFWEYASGTKSVSCKTCFAIEAGIGLAYPSQCIATWIIILAACIVPCILCYSYKTYMSGACSRYGGGDQKHTIVVETVAAPCATAAPTVQMTTKAP